MDFREDLSEKVNLFSLLQAIYLNKQDYMFAVGSLSKPNDPQA